MEHALIKTEEQPLPFTPDDLFRVLKELKIEYTLHHHIPIFTVEEGEHLKKSIAGVHCRNLFLKDKKGAMFLVVAANETKVDIKALSSFWGCGRLSFGSAERLWENLGIRPGSVNPFCIYNDKAHNIKVILDADMMKAQLVNYHPMDNAMTIGMQPADLKKYLSHCRHNPELVRFDESGAPFGV